MHTSRDAERASKRDISQRVVEFIVLWLSLSCFPSRTYTSRMRVSMPGENTNNTRPRGAEVIPIDDTWNDTTCRSCGPDP